MPRLLRMPGISADAEEVVFLEWCSSVGSTVAAGAAIATVETEKANVDIEAEEEVVLWRTLIEPGDAVAVGAPIAVLAGVGEDMSDEGSGGGAQRASSLSRHRAPVSHRRHRALAGEDRCRRRRFPPEAGPHGFRSRRPSLPRR